MRTAIPSPRSRLIGAIAAAALAGSALAASTAAPASADPIPTGSVSGTVVADGGAPIPESEVYLRDTGSGDSYYGTTGAAGDYFFGHLPAGTYTARFDAPGYTSEYYLNQSDSIDATPITVGAGNMALPANALTRLAPSVTPGPQTDLTGVVTDAASGAPIFDADVVAYDGATGELVDEVQTDTVGRYAFDGLDGHASVKIEFSRYGGGADLNHVPTWSGGARTKAGAAAVTLTAGTSVTASTTLTRAAGITGKVVNPAGVAPAEGYIEVYDMDGGYVSGSSLRDDGTYYANGLNAGEQYKVRVTSAYDYPNGDDDNDVHYYLDTWYGNASDAATSTAVATTSGTFTPNINITLGDSLVALKSPSISGKFQIGRTLTGDKGNWNKSGGSTFGYEWLRGGAVVGTNPTYKLTAADAGQSVALRVTNTNVSNGVERVATATTKATVAKYAAKVSGKAAQVKKGKKAGATQVTIRVKAAGQSARKITGTVKVTEGKKKVATVKVKKGAATFVLKSKFATAGKHTYTVKYNGNKTTLAAQGKVKIKIKK